MRFAYLIQAHQDPVHLQALVDRLCPPGGPDRAYVHVDAGSALWRAGGTGVIVSRREVTVIPNPVRVRWGHASQLLATRLLLRAALADGFYLAHLLSGQDWPVVPRDRIVAEAGDSCCIEARPGEQAERMERIRLDSRWLRPDPARPLTWYAVRALRRASALLPARRDHPWGPWHKGSQWWSLPRDACESALAGIDRAAGTGLLAGSLCSDEHLIQTIVAHDYGARLAGNRRYIRWGAASSPDVLRAADWPEVVASGAWFARKLDRTVDPFFLELA
ncbi:MAG: glycosyl transferase [Sphingomonadales bacterium]|nr:glycosyl transferase [Sphingomonadales bacterium]